MRVGLVTFDFPAQYRRADVAARATATDSPLMRQLRARGVEIVAPLAGPATPGGIRDAEDLVRSVYWAGRSSDPAQNLARVRIEPNLHGKSGGAVHFETPGCDAVEAGSGGVTFLRLFREGGRFAALLGEGRLLGEGPASRYADPWPHTRLALGGSPGLLFKAIPCNHGSLTEGRLGRELELFCAHAGIPVYRCDDDAGVQALLRDRRAGRVGVGGLDT
jgi:hypothetical protein